MNRRTFLQGSMAAVVGAMVGWRIMPKSSSRMAGGPLRPGILLREHDAPEKFIPYPTGAAIPMCIPVEVGRSAAPVVYRVYVPMAAVGECEPPADP